MKETGVLRRIDELGRIVIPKEIRKKLKIREGDSVDIFIENNNIILQKYSAMKDMEAVIGVLLESIHKVFQMHVIVTDTNQIIASTKANSHIGQSIHPELNQLLDGKEQITIGQHTTIKVTEKLQIEGYALVKPITSYGDLHGSIIVIAPQEFTKEKREALEFLSTFIVKYVES